MAFDDKAFFHAGTVIICSSLDINDVLSDCFTFLKQYIPLEMVEMSIFDAEINGIRILARHTEFDVSHDINQPIILSSQAIAYAKSQKGKIIFSDSSDPNQPSREIAAVLGLPDVVGIVLMLSINNENLGVVKISARGKQRFTKSHARLLRLLHDPFAIAMSNHLRYREVVRLKEMLSDDNQYLHKELHRISGDEIVGENFGLAEVMEMVAQVAPLDSNVLLLGETGVGKEVIANAVHYLSYRRKGPLIKMNCGGIPEGLIDSELFGHEKGAFTGAGSLRRGRFERAHGGTLFLDEVGELPLPAQVRLLRVLQEKKIERVGGSKSVFVDVRIIAATHRNLNQMVEKGNFREDLWYRLNVFPITIPPLRHRRTDIPSFIHHFIDRKTREMNLDYRPELAQGALERLQRYNWPGNVRELENAVERELIRNQSERRGDPLSFKDICNPASKPPPLQLTYGQSAKAENLSLNCIVSDHIAQVLQLTKGKIQGKDGAAALLGVNPSTLRHRMRKLGIHFGRKPVG